MRREQAEELLRLLCAAYRTSLSEETTELWLSRLRPLDATLGAKTIESVIAGVKFFPSFAEFNQHLEIVREQTARDRRAEERRQENDAIDGMELVAFDEILRRFPEVQTWLPGGDRVSGLPEEGRGECEECGVERPVLYRLNEFRLCGECARRRQRVAGIAS